MDLQRLRRWLLSVSTHRSHELLRLKGILHCQSHAQAMVIQGVSQWLEVRREAGEPPAACTLVLIGRHLDAEELRRAWAEYIARLESQLPRERREGPWTAAEDLAQQLDVSPAQFYACDWHGWTGKPGGVACERGWDAAAPQKLMLPTCWHGSVGRGSGRIPTKPIGRTMLWPGTVRGEWSPPHLTADRFLVEQTPAT
jgi:Cobalamin synthesis protein cobW C-terminal domain